MAHQKGVTNNPNGRPSGSKNKKSKEWETLGEAIRDRHAKRFNDELDNLEGREFIKAYTNIINYFKPRLQSTSLDTKINYDEQKRMLRSIFPDKLEIEQYKEEYKKHKTEG